MNNIRSPAPAGAFYFTKKIKKEGNKNGKIRLYN